MIDKDKVSAVTSFDMVVYTNQFLASNDPDEVVPNPARNDGGFPCLLRALLVVSRNFSDLILVETLPIWPTRLAGSASSLPAYQSQHDYGPPETKIFPAQTVYHAALSILIIFPTVLSGGEELAAQPISTHSHITTHNREVYERL